jgi:hypothetical protein
MLTLGAARANAQITTVIAPPKRNEPNQQEVVRRVQAAQDSVARITLTGMTQWVDSAAAALAIHPDTGARPASDTSAVARPVAAAPVNPKATSSQPSPAPTPEFRDGARAPDTATPMPTIALVGVILLLLGAMIRRAPRPSRVRVRR